jgi:hypothetical protein
LSFVPVTVAATLPYYAGVASRTFKMNPGTPVYVYMSHSNQNIDMKYEIINGLVV